MELNFNHLNLLSDSVLAVSYSGLIDYYLHLSKRSLEDAIILNPAVVAQRRAEISGFLECLSLLHIISFDQASDFMAELDNLIKNAKD